MFELINKTFNMHSEVLPSNSEIQKYFDDRNIEDAFLNHTKALCGLAEISNGKSEYKLKYSYTILSDEFLKTLRNLIEEFDFQEIVELNCGTGWFYFWMKKYRIPIKKCIDNLTWPSFSKNNTFLKDYITKSDSIEYVKNHSEVELFVLSWPYMDDCAYRIWNNMYDGQYLLYIGEPNGGATADHQFFNSISGSELICQSSLNLKNAHLSFPYIYDEPILLKKEGDNQ